MDGEPAPSNVRPTELKARPWGLSAAVALVIAGVYWLYASRQWALYRVPSWDLGIFTQLLRAYSELRSPIVPIKGDGFMLLGDHFHPLLVVLAPFYALHPSGFTLLAMQAVLFGLTAGIIAWFAIRNLGRWGALIGLAAGLSYLLAEAAASQFHEIALALPFLAISLGLLVERRNVAAILWALPLLGVKEDLPLTVAAIGVVVFIRAASRRERWWGIGAAVGGVVAFLVITSVILPALNPDGVWDYASDSILSLLLSDPGAAFGRLGTGIGPKVMMVALPLLIGCVICVRSPLLIVAIPTLGWRIASDVQFHWGTSWHYGAVLAPVVYLALVDALPGFKELIAERRQRLVVPIVSSVSLAISVILLPQFALWTLAAPDTWRTNPQVEAARAAEAQVADGEYVEMDITLMAYLAPRAHVMWLGNDNPTPDVMVLNQFSGTLHPAPEDASVYAAQRYPEVTWEQVFTQSGFLVARPVE